MAVPCNYSNRSSAHEWFQHSETGAQQEVKAARLGDSAILLSEKIAAQDLRDQVLQKRHQRELEMKRDQEECKAITKRERELLEEQNRKEADFREKQRLQLKHNLDQQLEEKRQLKAKEAEESQRYWVAQQQDLANWKQAQEEEKIRRILRSKNLQQERLDYLAKAEQKKIEERQRKLEFQKKLTDNFTAFVEQQDANRKKQFTSAGTGILNGGSSLSAPLGAESSTSAPASTGTYSLMHQIEERRKAKELHKQTEREYALKIQQDVADAKKEEELKQRKIREKNLLYKSYLEQQMQERARALQKQQEEVVNPATTASQGTHSYISGTRPW